MVNYQRSLVVICFVILVALAQHDTFGNDKPHDFYRKKMHQDHVEFIKEQNRLYGHHAKFGETQFTHLSREEFKASYLGGLQREEVPNVDSKDARHHPRLLQTSNTTGVYYGPGSTPPASFYVNWNFTNGTYVTSVKNQGACGSCWAFAGIAELQSYFLWKHKIYLDLSEQQMVDCLPAIQPSNLGCGGGFLDSVGIYAVRFPITTERNYPYNAAQTACNPARTPSSGYYQISSYIFISDCNTLANTLLNLKPIGVCVTIDSQWQTYISGVVPHCNNSTLGGHCVLLVGAASDGTNTTSTNYWIVKNSWGSTYGENGFMKLYRNVADPNGICGICTAGIYSK